MTEAEAKTKWCPFSRAEVFDAQGGCSGGNRGGGITSCIGSACMAWRWHDRTKRGDGPVEEALAHSALELPRPRPGHEWFAGAKAMGTEWHYGQFPLLGWCGLAGKP